MKCCAPQNTFFDREDWVDAKAMESEMILVNRIPGDLLIVSMLEGSG